MLKKIVSYLAACMPEILALTGAGCLIYGSGIIHPSGGWIMAGLVLTLAARELDRSGG